MNRPVERAGGGVAIVVPFVDHLGGMERIALGMARRFAAEGIASRVLSCRHLREDRTLGATTEQGSVRIERIGVLQRPPLLDLTWVLPGALRLASWRSKLRAVIAHHVPTAGALAGLASSWSGVPFAVAAHGSEDAGMLRRLPLARLRARLVNRASFVASVGPHLDGELASAGVRADLLRRVPNGVDTEQFRPATAAERHEARERFALDPGSFVIASSGRIAAGKRLELLTEGVRDLPEVRVLVAGDGPERERLVQSAPPQVRWLGTLADVRPLLAAADAFALPSAAEGMSLALLEAMACGLAPLVADIPAHRPVITHDVDGHVVAEASAEGWRRAIAEVGSNGSAPRLGRAARVRVERSFQLEHVHRFWLEWFRTL